MRKPFAHVDVAAQQQAAKKLDQVLFSVTAKMTVQCEFNSQFWQTAFVNSLATNRHGIVWVHLAELVQGFRLDERQKRNVGFRVLLWQQCWTYWRKE